MTIMAITVRQLADIPDLQTRVGAGTAGLETEIAWAQVSELPDPTQWLDTGELLMTNGFSIPEGANAQRAYIEQLSKVGVSGLLIGEHAQVPELSPQMFSAAEEFSLPILFTAYEVPFSAVIRAVADANDQEERVRLVQAQRIYEVARLAASSNTSNLELVSRLGDLVDCHLHVLDPDRGVSPLSGDLTPSEEVIEKLKAVKAEREEPMPAVIRLEVDSNLLMVLSVPASRAASLVVAPRSADSPDLTVLRHIAAVVAFEIEKETAERERRRRLGSELLAGLVDRRMPAESAAQLLGERGLEEEPRVLVVCTIDSEEAEHSDLHLRLEDRGIPHVLLRRAPLLMALLRSVPEELDGFQREINSQISIGLSDPLGNADRAPDAQREAQWALEGARASGKSIARYGEDAALSPFLPRSLSESRGIVDHILGPILEYDASRGSELTLSLRAYLVYNRSWQKAAAELHVHKQTLIYRIQRVEQLSGKRLDETRDVAELWFALQAAEALGYLRSS